MPTSELGATVRKARETKGWSRATLAKHSGVSSTTIARIELRGDAPLIATLALLAQALELDFGALMTAAA